jgi:threonine dehydrogenase-like Zn-dependent dehydrogenase
VIFTPRDCQPRDERAVLDSMARGALRLEDLVTDVFAPEDAPRVYAGLGEHGLIPLFQWV